MKTLLLSLAASAFFILQAGGQTTFIKTIGTSASERAHALKELPGGDIIIAGYSYNGNGRDGYLLRLDAKGQVRWSRTYGGEQDDEFWDVIPTADGGFVAVGSTIGDRFYTSAYIVKTDGEGIVQWARGFNETTGGARNDFAATVKELSNGDLIVAGMGSLNGNANGFAARLTGTGDFIWIRKDESENYTLVWSMDLNTDSTGFVVPGSVSTSGYYSNTLTNLDFDGQVIWSRKYNLGENSGAFDIDKCPEGYVLSGGRINDAYYTAVTTDGQPAWMVRIKLPNTILRTEKTVVVGASFVSVLYDADNDPLAEGMLVMFDKNGILWGRRYGGIALEKTDQLVQTADGGFLLCGYTNSIGEGGDDIFVVKTDAKGLVQDAGCLSGDIEFGFEAGTFTGANRFAQFVSVSDSLVVSDASSENEALVRSHPRILRVTADPLEICRNEKATLTATYSLEGATYNWSPATSPAQGASVVVTPDSTTTYYLTAFREGCADTSSVTITVKDCTGILEISPGSKTGAVLIRLDGTVPAGSTLSVYSLSGQLVMEMPCGENGELDLSGQPAGLYLLSCQLDGKILGSARLMKE